jgi:hypothetical protein
MSRYHARCKRHVMQKSSVRRQLPLDRTFGRRQRLRTSRGKSYFVVCDCSHCIYISIIDC